MGKIRVLIFNMQYCAYICMAFLTLIPLLSLANEERKSMQSDILKNVGGIKSRGKELMLACIKKWDEDSSSASLRNSVWAKISSEKNAKYLIFELGNSKWGAYTGLLVKRVENFTTIIYIDEKRQFEYSYSHSDSKLDRALNEFNTIVTGDSSEKFFGGSDICQITTVYDGKKIKNYFQYSTFAWLNRESVQDSNYKLSRLELLQMDIIEKVRDRVKIP